MKKDVFIKDVSFSYDKEAGSLLDKICITIRKGEFVGILGPNGCGKSTLLKIILKYLLPSSGIVEISDKDLKEYSQLELSRILSLVPQKSSLNMPLTVEDVVYMGRVPYMKNKWKGFDKEDRDKVDNIMEILQIEKFRNRSVFSLSGGEFQRVLMARALVQDTEIMLLDEPTSALDMNYALEIMKISSYFVKEKNLTAIMVLHDLNLASMYCDRIIFLKDSRIAYEGTPDELFKPEIMEEIYGFKCEVVQNNGFYYVIPDKI